MAKIGRTKTVHKKYDVFSVDSIIDLAFDSAKFKESDFKIPSRNALLSRTVWLFHTTDIPLDNEKIPKWFQDMSLL